MKTFLTTAAIVGALAFPALAESSVGSDRGESSNNLTQSQQESGVKAGMDAKASGAKASGGAAIKETESTGAGTPQDTAGSKDAPGDKTGVSGGNKN